MNSWSNVLHCCGVMFASSAVSVYTVVYNRSLLACLSPSNKICFVLVVITVLDDQHKVVMAQSLM